MNRPKKSRMKLPRPTLPPALAQPGGDYQVYAPSRDPDPPKPPPCTKPPSAVPAQTPTDIILPECSSCPALCCRSLNIELSLASEHDRSLVKSLPDSSRLVGTRLLLSRRHDGSCVLLNNHRCTVWNHRPLACRVYSCLSRPEADLLCFDALRHGINPKDSPPFFTAMRLTQPPPKAQPPATHD